MSVGQDSYEYIGNQYKVTCHLAPGDTPKIVFQGAMRLEGTEEEPVNKLLARVVTYAPGYDHVELDLHGLDFINSRGISVLYKFTINLRNKGVNVNIYAVKQSTWQQATLNNILKLSPNSTITWLESAG